MGSANQTHCIQNSILLLQRPEKRFKFPVVDDQATSLASSSVLPMDAEGMPKDNCDRQIEQALRKDFVTSVLSLRALAMGSLFTRTAFSWASDLAAAESNVPKDLKDEIKKIGLTSAFAADATLDALLLAARAMACSAITRSKTWLQNWDVDSAARTSVSFKGVSLFRDGLERYLVEDRRRRCYLQKKKKDGECQKRFRSF